MPPKGAFTIFFNDGTKLSFASPRQTDSHNITSKFDELLSGRHISIEADGTLLVIPLSSIKYVQADPAPDVLPGSVIQGTTIIS